MIQKRTAIKYAIELMDYCQGRKECQGCPFNKPDYLFGVCGLAKEPSGWYIKKPLPSEIKDTRKQRMDDIGYMSEGW